MKNSENRSLSSIRDTEELIMYYYNLIQFKI